MFTPHPDDERHNTKMITLLRAILADNTLSNYLMFKGGTCAALRSLLNRFSVDLDFDITTKDHSIQKDIKNRLYKIFQNLSFRLDDESQHHLQFFLKYDAPDKARNTLKLEINDEPSPENDYEATTLKELDLICNCQTIPTMIANKLVAALNRIKTKGHPAGRDFFDLRAFFYSGLPIKKSIVEERTGQRYQEYLTSLIEYVKKDLKPIYLYQDLNMLLPSHNFKHEVDKIIPELTLLLQNELKRQEGV